jgi:hypothetical protein
MNCHEFEELSRELAIARSKNLDLSLNALGHLDECSNCSQRLREEQSLSRCLTELAQQMKSLSAPSSVAERLLLAHRQRFSTPVRVSGRDDRRRVWLAVAAVVLLLVLGSIILRLRERPSPIVGHLEPKPQPATVRDAVETPAPRVASDSSAALSDHDAPPEARANSFRHARRAGKRSVRLSQLPAVVAVAPVAAAPESEVATRFIALSYGGPINPQDDGLLVRVELPRSAMLSLGWPVNMDRYAERVKADVLLGPDGLARAIRFVQ